MPHAEAWRPLLWRWFCVCVYICALRRSCIQYITRRAHFKTRQVQTMQKKKKENLRCAVTRTLIMAINYVVYLRPAETDEKHYDHSTVLLC